MPPPTTPPGAPPMAGPTVNDCKQIKPRGDFALMKEKKNCFRDIAKALMTGPGMPSTGDPNMPPPTAPPGTPPMAGRTVDECKQMKPRGDYALLKDKKRCFRDAARALGAEEIAPGQLQKCKQIKARGDFALMKQKKNCMRDLARSLMAGPGMPPTGDPNMPCLLYTSPSPRD